MIEFNFFGFVFLGLGCAALAVGGLLAYVLP